ncbi:unnamed protein product [Soboliphyme baturini]|uniref:Uncharacterized protein n=1 Tax=Soboliphyme baturini TaxID=241478 RepID=A0A183J3Y0_9BILA|nr:unnamed protein product [Soboliphyme baturini]
MFSRALAIVIALLFQHGFCEPNGRMDSTAVKPNRVGVGSSIGGLDDGRATVSKEDALLPSGSFLSSTMRPVTTDTPLRRQNSKCAWNWEQILRRLRLLQITPTSVSKSLGESTQLSGNASRNTTADGRKRNSSVDIGGFNLSAIKVKLSSIPMKDMIPFESSLISTIMMTIFIFLFAWSLSVFCGKDRPVESDLRAEYRCHSDENNCLLFQGLTEPRDDRKLLNIT